MNADDLLDVAKRASTLVVDREIRLYGEKVLTMVAHHKLNESLWGGLEVWICDEPVSTATIMAAHLEPDPYFPGTRHQETVLEQVSEHKRITGQSPAIIAVTPKDCDKLGWR